MSNSRLDARRLYNISLWLEYLRTRNADAALIGEGESRDRMALGALSALISVLEDRELLVPRLPELRRLRDKWNTRVTEFEKSVPRPTNVPSIGYVDAPELAKAVDHVSSALTDYLIENNFEQVRPASGLFDYSRIINEGLAVVIPDQALLKGLPDDVTLNLKISVDCICRDLPTACVMLGLRAAEGMIRHQYELHSGNPAPEESGWFDLATDLFKALESMGARKRETNQLKGYVDALRLLRNRAMHPGETFELIDAENTIVSVRSMITLLDATSKSIPSGGGTKPA